MKVFSRKGNRSFREAHSCSRRKLREGEEMFVEVHYNENEGARSRGMNSDTPDKIEEFTAVDEIDAIQKIFLNVFGWDEEDVTETFDGKIPTVDDLIDFANNVDITGGDPILFDFNIGGETYTTDWDPSIFDKEFTEEDAVKEAFPEADPSIVSIISKWYRNEGAIEDFGDVTDFASFIEEDIEEMLDAASGPEANMVRKELEKLGYIDL